MRAGPGIHARQFSLRRNVGGSGLVATVTSRILPTHLDSRTRLREPLVEFRTVGVQCCEPGVEYCNLLLSIGRFASSSSGATPFRGAGTDQCLHAISDPGLHVGIGDLRRDCSSACARSAIWLSMRATSSAARCSAAASSTVRRQDAATALRGEKGSGALAFGRPPGGQVGLGARTGGSLLRLGCARPGVGPPA